MRSHQWGKSEISWRNGCGYIEIWGDINKDNIDAVYHALLELPLGLYVLMTDVEIDEGPVLAHLISALRLIKPVCIIEAPRLQVLLNYMSGEVLIRTFPVQGGGEELRMGQGVTPWDENGAASFRGFASQLPSLF